MQAASKQLKTEHKKIDIDKIEDMNDDLADMFEDMNEVSEVSVPKTERPREREIFHFGANNVFYQTWH